AGFRGGVRVAAGDADGDGRDEIITAPGAGGGPHVRVFDFDPLTGAAEPIGGFFAYDPDFRSGVFVAAGDADLNGAADIFTGTGFGGGPHVKAFATPQGDPLVGPLGSFLAYDESFRGGVRVAAADVFGTGTADLITAPGPGGGSHVKVFRHPQPDPLAQPFAFPNGVRVGTHVAAGAGAANFPSTSDAEIAQAFADVEAAVLRARRALRPAA